MPQIPSNFPRVYNAPTPEASVCGEGAVRDDTPAVCTTVHCGRGEVVFQQRGNFLGLEKLDIPSRVSQTLNPRRRTRGIHTRWHRVPPSSTDPSNLVPLATEAGLTSLAHSGESPSLTRFPAWALICAAWPRSARWSPRCSWCQPRRKPLVLKAAARSLENHTLEIRHRERTRRLLPADRARGHSGRGPPPANLQSWMNLPHEP